MKIIIIATALIVTAFQGIAAERMSGISIRNALRPQGVRRAPAQASGYSKTNAFVYKLR
ncbi:MAG: hypothetical protein PF904_20765 [Kiritimatiellae bacterium]|nr:hypothetical protein [Kiritimatiellia bacterium]